MLGSLQKWLGSRLARFLSQPTRCYRRFAVSDPRTLHDVLEPGDVLLVEGNLRFSALIKVVTQSMWSHAALYVGSDALPQVRGAEPPTLIEADLVAGIVAVPLSKYDGYNTRICRPIGLVDADRERVIAHARERLGDQYDLKNVLDLLRYLLPPALCRHRRPVALGSDDPTRAICSTFVALAFQAVRYPILPHVRPQETPAPSPVAGPPGEEGIRAGKPGYTEREILEIRHHSLFTPSDFDLSPYFRVVKPTIERGFDYRALAW